MKNLDEDRHQLYKWRYPHKPALALLKIIEENEIRASYYKQGSIFYAPYYEKWKEAAEALIKKGYTVGQLMEMKETVQNQLASVAKTKKEIRKEENLINSILYEKCRTQVIEREMPEPEIQDIPKQNVKEADMAGKGTAENQWKGGGAGRSGPMGTDHMPAQPDTYHMEKQPAHNRNQEQAR